MTYSAATPKSVRLLEAAARNWPRIVAALVIYYLAHNHYRRGLHKIPGPFFRTLSPFPRVWSVYRGFSHDDDIALHRKYGPIVRVAPNVLSVNTASEINSIYGVGAKFIKGKFYSLVESYDEEGLVPDPFVLTDKDLHARVKRSAASSYSLNSLVQLEMHLRPVTQRLLDILDRDYTTTDGRLDLGPLLQCYAMDAIFSLTFGKDLNHMDKGDYLAMFKGSKFINDYMAIVSLFTHFE